jgi:hypothetical protein
MKLISKFHDYYDSVLSQGRDESVVYVRSRDVVTDRLSPDMVPWLAPLGHGLTAGHRSLSIRDRANHERAPRWSSLNHVNSETNWRFEEAFVLVAGSAHAVWVGYGREKALLGEELAGGAPLGEVDPQALVAAMRQGLVRTPKPPDVRVVPGIEKPDGTRVYNEARARLLAHDFTDLHLELQAPVLLVSSRSTLRGPDRIDRLETQTDEALRSNVRIIRNPRLADLGFARALDPFSCFQRISQFIGGVVPGQQMPMVEISDKSKIAKKGFDPKYGFRTRPSS